MHSFLQIDMINVIHILLQPSNVISIIFQLLSYLDQHIYNTNADIK